MENRLELLLTQVAELTRQNAAFLEELRFLRHENSILRQQLGASRLSPPLAGGLPLMPSGDPTSLALSHSPVSHSPASEALSAPTVQPRPDDSAPSPDPPAPSSPCLPPSTDIYIAGTLDHTPMPSGSQTSVINSGWCRGL